MGRIWENYKIKLQTIRPFLRTKIGSKLAIFAILDFIALFLAPLIHGFVGTALFGCVASVFLMLVWRRYDREHVVVPAVILCIPLLLDMIIYHDLSVVVGCFVSITALLLVSLLREIGFYDRITDKINSLLIAGAICVAVVVAACITLVLVQIAWWILCIIAFFAVVAIFMGVVFSTAAYTASDGRRQARKNRRRQIASGEEAESEEEEEEEQESSRERRYRTYRPRKSDTTVYNLDDKDLYDRK